MAENLRLARLYFVILAIVAGGRWVMSLQGVPYAKGTDKLSIVIVTLLSSIFYGAFCRRWRGFKILQAVTLGATLGLSAQVVIFVSTLLSYLLGLDDLLQQPDRPERHGRRPHGDRPRRPRGRPRGQHHPERHRRSPGLGDGSAPARIALRRSLASVSGLARPEPFDRLSGGC